jgi:hypothetical protein
MEEGEQTHNHHNEGKKTHCYYPDTNTLKKSRYCPGKSVTLEEGEALVKQGN